MKYLLIGLLVLGFFSCSEPQSQITSKADYDKYLVNNKNPKTTSKYFQLWNNKITADSTEILSFGNVASEYTRYFKNTGNISYLKKAEQALSKAVEIANINKESYAISLARNYISQHRFKEALQMTKLADSIGGSNKETQSLYFDVHMELGNFAKAERYLDSIKNFSEFGYLIRLAKWNDYKGDLDTTIKMMEKAMKKAESSNNHYLKLWSYTNIADYYGHAGRLEESYHFYLKALNIDPQNAYAKKGLAWIVFSHERNGTEALRILDSVTAYHKAPDYYALKAEIANFMGDEIAYENNMTNYYNQAQNEAYGPMYNTYQINYYIDYDRHLKRARRLAEIEVENRPTPESYSYLASTYLEMGREQEALKIVEAHIIGKTFEPGILLNAAKIFKANQHFEKVEALKPELIGAVYELGPAAKKQIYDL
ncbi:tetratricopeptide repeat protein [Croceivirga thetidis]|uniref:Tetratricopeptide repeat protein n=1 Tax=Croceivirga thetidis TaxID=2721623 RepID=A0ABX1GUQ6_9FLAO|nr:tetratricopeptide repeat protein [Croceivirga thetidis]NKI32725.1 tetratricopeptide repeat protein [Croceivirga thetidis]